MTKMALNALLTQALRAATVGLLLFLGGCMPLYIPPFGSISAERLGEIKVGTTTRQQVIDLLGEPDRLKHENFSVYDLYSSKGELVFVVATYQPAAPIGEFPLDTRYYRVLLEFDSNAVLKRYEIEEGIPHPTIFKAGGGVLPYGLGGASEVKRVFKGVVRGWLGESQITLFRSVAFSPDGRSVAAGVAGGAGPVCLWDAETGDQKMVLEEGGPLVRFSPDGKLVATFGDDMPTIWEVSSAAKKLSFEGHGTSGFFTSRDVHALAFSHDSKKIVSGAADGSIKVWEATTGKVLKTFEETEGISSVIFSPDGKILAATCKEVISWEPATGKELGRITAGSEGGARAFSPDGGLLAVATLSHVEIWRLPFDYQPDQPAHAESGKATRPRGREGLVMIFLLPYVSPSFNRPSVVFSPDGSKVAASAAGAMIGDLATQTTLLRYLPSQMFSKPHDHDMAGDVAFSSDGKMLALATGKGVYVFDVPGKRAAEGAAIADPSGEAGEAKK